MSSTDNIPPHRGPACVPTPVHVPAIPKSGDQVAADPAPESTPEPTKQKSSK